MSPHSLQSHLIMTQMHFDVVMAKKEEQATLPVSAFQILQEEHRYNVQLLKQH